MIAAVWAGIFFLGLGAGWVGWRDAREALAAGLRDEAVRCAAAFDAEETARLAADPRGKNSTAAKVRLHRLREANPRARTVSLFRFAPETGAVVRLADSKPSGPGDETPAGGITLTDGLQEVLRTGQPALDALFTDEQGVWATGYALVAETPSAKNAGPIKDVIGVVVEAGDWLRVGAGAAAERAAIAWLLLGLPFAAWRVVRRQHAQREAIRNLSEAMEQSHSALMIVDLDSTIEYANRGLVNQIGYSRRELIGRNWRDFQVADTPPERIAELVSTVRSGRPWQGEWFNRRKDGSVYPVRGVITPVKDRDGRMMSFVAVFDDMTEIKRQEAELRDARDRAQAGDRAKGQFLATMSHEVRTPLNGIIGFTNLLLGSPLSDEQREYVETIRTGGEALIQLTGDILDYARIETGKLKLDLAPCDPRACVEEALDLFADRAAEKNLCLLHWIGDDVPAAIVADGGRLRQVLVNLVSNAVKFTEAGEVEVTVSRVAGEKAIAPADRESCLLTFAVRDTGAGIAPEEGTKLFKPFSQLDSSSTRKHGGTGLGLAISRDLVRLMGGDITLTSGAGRGATFSFTLRATVASAAVTPSSLDGLTLVLIALPDARRAELARLAARWGATVVEIDSLAKLPPPDGWDLALVTIDGPLARTLAAQTVPSPALPPGKAFAIVPMALGTDLRAALRPHFRLLINQPVHHGALYDLLSGERPAAPCLAAPTQFGLRVLLVEDNAVNQRLMERVLQNLGCTWHVAANGRLAVEELARTGGDYDLVLLDLHMPELDGIGVLEQIRAGRAGRRAQSIWVSALTADAREEQKIRAHAAGIDDYLVKPVQPPELEAAFQRYRAARKK
jgi:PAS domain S-box-containing protein